MSESYISMDIVIDRINNHPDVKSTAKAHAMLIALGNKQNLVRKPRTHIIKSKTKKLCHSQPQ